MSSQSSGELEGVLRIDKINAYDFKIKYKWDSVGKLSGYSIFNIGKQDETKTMISGSFKNQKLEFKEYKIISTASKDPLENMCYIHYSGSFKKILGIEMIAGDFVGYYKNGKKCSKGTINFVDKNRLHRKMDSTHKISLQKDSTNTKEKKDFNLLSNILPIEKLDGAQTSILWLSDSLKFVVWDKDKVDNDRIKIVIDSEVLSENILLSSDEFVYKKPINKSTNITLTAINNGYIPPNTSTLLLVDGKNRYLYNNNLSEGKSATYKIIIKK